VVFASSSAVYGNTNTIPLNEEMPPRPQSPYAISKLAGEYYCRVFSDLFNVKTVSLRYFNVFGPGQNPRSRYAAVIPRFIMRILKHKPPVIFGDGMQTRDFIYVNDAVQANLRAMEGTATGVFNIGCGRRVNLITLASAVMEVCGTDLRIQFEDARPGEVRDSCADISRAGDGLGFVPEYTLAEGLKETTAWYRKRYPLR
jgi:UDP-glucose 4-epimerase